MGQSPKFFATSYFYHPCKMNHKLLFLVLNKRTSHWITNHHDYYLNNKVCLTLKMTAALTKITIIDNRWQILFMNFCWPLSKVSTLIYPFTGLLEWWIVIHNPFKCLFLSNVALIKLPSLFLSSSVGNYTTAETTFPVSQNEHISSLKLLIFKPTSIGDLNFVKRIFQTSEVSGSGIL